LWSCDDLAHGSYPQTKAKWGQCPVTVRSHPGTKFRAPTVLVNAFFDSLPRQHCSEKILVMHVVQSVEFKIFRPRLFFGHFVHNVAFVYDNFGSDPCSPKSRKANAADKLWGVPIDEFFERVHADAPSMRTARPIARSLSGLSIGSDHRQCSLLSSAISASVRCAIACKFFVDSAQSPRLDSVLKKSTFSDLIRRNCLRCAFSSIRASSVGATVFVVSARGV
jgi:hypothetical protein